MLSTQDKVLELSQEILELCNGKSHNEILMALMNVVINVTTHANSGQFTSETVRVMTNVQEHIVGCRPSTTFSPKEYNLN